MQGAKISPYVVICGEIQGLPNIGALIEAGVERNALIHEAASSGAGSVKPIMYVAAKPMP
jgi:hypothetical protein